MTSLLLALALAAQPPAPGEGATGPAAPHAATADTPLQRQRAALANDIVKLGARVQHDIERGDVEALVARVPADGLRCAGRRIPKERVSRELRDRGSWVHGVIFGGPGATAPAGQPASLKALFDSAREIAVAVAFRPDAAAGPVGRPCLAYRAPGLITPGSPLCFERRGKEWLFAESLYPCD